MYWRSRANCLSVVATLALSASFATVTAELHDVIPVRDSQFYWGLNPHDDVTVGKGGKVIFRTAKGFHDVAYVSTAEEYEACDVSNAEAWVGVDGDLQDEDAGEVEVVGGAFYEFTYFANTPGTYHVLCTVGEGSHCRTGQRITITVTDTPSNDIIRVMGSAVPFWTVAVQYADMTIKEGDSVRFVSDTEGFHDVVLLDGDRCGASDAYECCTSYNILPAVLETLYSPSDFISNLEFVWTPPGPGTYEVACAVANGGHCAFGQRFKLTVEGDPGSAPLAPPQSESAEGPGSALCVPSSLPGYSCMKTVGDTDDFSVHWGLPDANTVKLAAQAKSEGWIALGTPADGRGLMTGSQVVQASSEGSRSISLEGYSPSTFLEVSIPGVAANGISYQLAQGIGLLELSRVVANGIDTSVPVNMIGAYGLDSNLDSYHMSTGHRSFQIDLSAEPSKDAILDDKDDTGKREDDTDKGGLSDKGSPPGSSDDECNPSEIPGLDCVLSTGGVRVHWAVVDGAAGPSAVNVAVQAEKAGDGWVAVGFPSEPGSGMVGGHVLQGSPASGLRKVELGGYSASTFTEAPENSLLRTAVTNERLEAVGGTTTVFLTINAVSGIDLSAAVPLIMAWNPKSSSLSASHSPRDRLAADIDFLSGAEVAATSPKQSFWLLHGALMFAGWGLMIPAGVTAASSFKHKDPAWFKAHRALNTGGLLLALAGFVVALVELRPLLGTPIVTSHFSVGVLVMALGCVQPVMAYFRPPKTDPKRAMFNYVHWGIGFTAVTLGLANCGIGTYMLGELARDLSWLKLALLVYLALVILVYAALRVLSTRRGSISINEDPGSKDKDFRATRDTEEGKLL